MGQRAVLETELPHILGEEPTKQSCSCGATQLLPGKNNSSDHPGRTGIELPQLSIATHPMDRRNQILLTIQTPGKTTSKLLFVCQYQDWTPKE
jgi:hypothetical protein